MLYLDDSLHPEWLAMYAAGLSVRRIAELENVPTSTAKAHIQRRRAADPGLAAQHAAAASSTREPTDRWRGRLYNLRDFIATQGRYPVSAATDSAERALYVWLATQRHAFLAQKLSWGQAKELGEVLGDWLTTDLEKQQDARWLKQLDAVVVFVAEHDGKLPRYQPDKSPAEHKLGIWIQGQRQAVLHGRILPWRLEELENALPGWRRARKLLTPPTTGAGNASGHAQI